MATLPTLNDAIKAVIYKKVDDNGTIKYVPYFPRTDAEWVALKGAINIHGTGKAANTDMDTIVNALNNAIGATNASASSASTASLQAQITYAINAISAKAGAFIYKKSAGAISTHEIPTAFCVRVLTTSIPQAGWVFNISNNFKIDSNGAIYSSTDHDAYRQGTNVVITGSGTDADPYKFDALGGDMGNHALTSEAIGYLGITTNGELAWGYVSEGQATHSLGFPSKINITASNENLDYYITFVDGSGNGKTVYIDSATTPLSYNPSTNTIQANLRGHANDAYYADTAYNISVGSQVENSGTIIGFVNPPTEGTAALPAAVSPIQWASTSQGAGTASNYLNVNITGKAATAGSADTATTAASVGHSFHVGALSYNGSSNVTLNFTTSQGLHWYSVDGSSGLGVALDSTGGLTHSSTGVKLATSGVAAGTYSAVQVDTYGRATAGGQSIVFANSTSDPDLNQLVVGGLAFISTSETAKTGTVPTNSMDLNN